MNQVWPEAFSTAPLFAGAAQQSLDPCQEKSSVSLIEVKATLGRL
jgi:hypothetical protein